MKYASQVQTRLLIVQDPCRIEIRNKSKQERRTSKHRFAGKMALFTAVFLNSTFRPSTSTRYTPHPTIDPRQSHWIGYMANSKHSLPQLNVCLIHIGPH